MDVFVAREKQRAKLTAALKEALGGHGGVVFITGEAGSGKSELMSRFVAEAKTAHPQLLGTVRGWYATRGVIEPYQLFFEILAILEPEAQARSKVALLHKWVRCFKIAFRRIPGPIKDYAPKMVSPIGLELPVEAVLKLAEELTKETSTEGRTLVPLRYAERLTRLAGGHPVVLGLDDLHRADAHSCGLLAYLGQQVVTHPILLIGAFRPQDIDSGHPLEELRLELRRAGAVEIPLDALMQHLPAQRTFVNSYLDSAYTPNALDTVFRNEIVRRTEGNPLFVSELLQLYVERGWIRQEGGQWVQAAKIRQELPSYPHGLFKLRWRQLSSDDQEILDAAAVEGEQFTLEVVAAVLQKPIALVRTRLEGELGMERGWIAPAGTVRFPNRSFNRYRFRHTLYYEFVYAQLQLRPATLTSLHGRMGMEKKELWSTRWVEIAPELAEHFKRGENWPEAWVCYEQVLVDLKQLEDRRRQAEALLNLADVLRKMRNLECAAKCFRQTVELTRGLDPTLQERASTDLAWILFDRGRFAEAAPLFQEVIVSHRSREEEPSPRLFFGLAVVLFVTRQREAADAALNQAIDYEHCDESDLHDAKQWLSQLSADTPGVVEALQRLEKVVI